MIKKILNFTFLLIMFFTCTIKVDAIVNVDGAIFSQAPQLGFYDNTKGVLTSVGSGYYPTYGYWLSNNSLVTTGANTDGVNVTFTANEGFVAGYTYSLSILIGTESSRAKPSSSRICIAENIDNANTRFQSSSFSCTNAISITSMDGTANFDFGDVSTPYTILTYVFTADFTSPTITLTYNTISGNNSKHLFGGYHLEVLSDNKTGVSSSEVQSIINNSGLASADSVEELQTEIENVKQDITTAGDAIVESNKETQDVIKDQFNDCHNSSNLFNVTDYRNLRFNTNAGATYTLTNDSAIVVSVSSSNSSGIYLTNDYVSQYVDNFDTNKFYYVSADIISDKEFQLQFGGKIRNNFNVSVGITRVKIYTNFETLGLVFYARSTDITFAIKNIQFSTDDVSFEPYGKELCTNRLDQTNDQLGNLNENITSDNVDKSKNEASSFFDNFNTTDNGGISSVVTAPLVAIEKMLSGTCEPLTATYSGKTLSLPCGNSFWDGMSEIRTFLNVILGGFLCYGILSKLYLLIDRLKNPEDDRVDVMKL